MGRVNEEEKETPRGEGHISGTNKQNIEPSSTKSKPIVCQYCNEPGNISIIVSTRKTRFFSQN